MNGNHVNGTNGAEVTLRGAKTRVNEEGGRTTMVVRLHPGQTNRLSAYVEDQVIKENLNLCQKNKSDIGSGLAQREKLASRGAAR